MLSIDKDLQPILMFYILLCVVLYYLKPEIMFHKDGKFKCFGTGSSKTIAPFWVVTLMGGILFYVYTRVKKDSFA